MKKINESKILEATQEVREELMNQSLFSSHQYYSPIMKNESGVECQIQVIVTIDEDEFQDESF